MQTGSATSADATVAGSRPSAPAGTPAAAQPAVPERVRALLGDLADKQSGPDAPDMRDFLSRLSTMLNLNSSTAGALSLYALLPRLDRTFASALGAEACAILVHDAPNGTLFAPGQKGQSDVRQPQGAGLMGSVFTTGEPVIVNDPKRDPRFDPVRDNLTGADCSGVLLFPLRSSKGEMQGVCQLVNKLDGAFDEHDVTLLDMLAKQAAPLIENTLFFEGYKQSRKEDMKLLEITTALTSDIQLDTLLEKIVGVVTEILGADRCTIFLHDPRRDELWSRIASGMGSKEIRFPSHLGIAGSVFKGGKIVNIKEAYEDPRFNQEVDKRTGYRTKTILCMPIVTKKGEPIGVCQVLNKKHGTFSVDDERRLSGFTAQVSIALENASLFDKLAHMKLYNDSILRSLNHGVVTLDAERRVAKLNEAAMRMLALDPAKVARQPLAEVLGEANQWVLDSLARVEESGAEDVTFDTELKLAASVITVNMTAVPLRDPSGKSLGSMLIVEDISADKRLKSTMSRYMTKEVMEQMLAGGEAALGGKLQEVTVLFSDIREFTTISERIGPRETVSMLNDYFTRMVDAILQAGGTLDKYIGDAIMALFGTPLKGERDADNAIAAALGMVVGLKVFNIERTANGHEPLDIGIGINTGEVIVGNIGSPKRMDYTVIGDGVNLAARIESLTRYYGARVMIAEGTLQRLKLQPKLRQLDVIRVKGKTRPVTVYEVLDHYDEAEYPRMDEVMAINDEAQALYRARAWGEAEKRFQEILALRPGDKLAGVYLKRLGFYKDKDPGRGWDGVWTFDSK